MSEPSLEPLDPLAQWLRSHRPPTATPRIVLAVDQATQTGWSLHVERIPVESGAFPVRDFAARESVVMRAAHAARGAPWLFAFEDHSTTPLKSYKSTAQLLALGAALGLWLDAIARLGHLDVMILGVSSRSWRRKVLGASESVGRVELKAQAVRWAQSYTGKRDLTDDEADACAIGAFASYEPLRKLSTHKQRALRGKRCATR